MPTFVIENMPVSLYRQIQHLAEARRQTPEVTVLDVLESALCTPASILAETPLPQEPFLTEERSAPCTIPRPIGEITLPIDLFDYAPLPHDLPDGV